MAKNKRYGKWNYADRHPERLNGVYVPIETERDVEDLRNAMIQGNYPASMSDCEVVGINGDCGVTCPVFQRGECKEWQDVTDDVQILWELEYYNGGHVPPAID